MTTKQLNKQILSLLNGQAFTNDQDLLTYIQTLREEYADNNVAVALWGYHVCYENISFLEWVYKRAYEKFVLNNPNAIKFKFSRNKTFFFDCVFVAGYRNSSGKRYLLYSDNGDKTNLGGAHFQMAWRSTNFGGALSILNSVLESWSQRIENAWALFEMVNSGDFEKIKEGSYVYKPDSKVTFTDLKSELPQYVK